MVDGGSKVLYGQISRSKLSFRVITDLSCFMSVDPLPTWAGPSLPCHGIWSVVRVNSMPFGILVSYISIQSELFWPSCWTIFLSKWSFLCISVGFYVYAQDNEIDLKLLTKGLAADSEVREVGTCEWYFRLKTDNAHLLSTMKNCWNWSPKKPILILWTKIQLNCFLRRTVGDLYVLHVTENYGCHDWQNALFFRVIRRGIGTRFSRKSHRSCWQSGKGKSCRQRKTKSPLLHLDPRRLRAWIWDLSSSSGNWHLFMRLALETPLSFGKECTGSSQECLCIIFSIPFLCCSF